MKTPNLVNCPCQHCNGKIEFDRAELSDDNNKVACPHCGLETLVFVPPPPPIPALAPANPKPPEQWIPSTEAERIRDLAGSFEFIGKGIIALSLLVIGLFGIAIIGGDAIRSPWAVYIAAAGIGLGMWCYLVAQIIYIRASLEKD